MGDRCALRRQRRGAGFSRDVVINALQEGTLDWRFNVAAAEGRRNQQAESSAVSGVSGIRGELAHLVEEQAAREVWAEEVDSPSRRCRRLKRRETSAWRWRPASGTNWNGQRTTKTTTTTTTMQPPPQ